MDDGGLTLPCAWGGLVSLIDNETPLNEKCSEEDFELI
jgi:hypothetical protein